MAKHGRKTPVQSKKQSKEDYSDKKRLRRFLFIYAPIIVITLGFIYVSSFDPVKPAARIQIEGIILEVVASSGDATQDTYRVKLSNGNVVTVSGREKKDINKGTKVLIEESETLLFKRKIYSFIRFIE
jgi:cell division septal protein FtsQ